ncbi:dimethylsulfoniopropionate lyase [Pseudomonas citri]|uniref:dimethylsulfoniopropionate lyase n=1 Tax=Pseudomonas citri TaxID=2978349 RepID=UPI0021B6C1F9|nr:dimethylsulfoniopropionate lyase [Pseudomonas citri]
MIDNTENRTADPVWFASGRSLQRALHRVLSDSLRVSDGVPDSIGAFVASLNSAEWLMNEPSQALRELPASLQPCLSQALESAPRDSEPLVAVLDALGILLPHASWIERQAGPGQDDRFVQRHRHGLITGPGGLFECPTLSLGVAIMAADTCYPYHQHPPAEFYLVLSQGEWYREDVGWWSPGAGGVVLNPENCVHAMRSAEAPLLALWGLIHPR